MAEAVPVPPKKGDGDAEEPTQPEIKTLIVIQPEVLAERRRRLSDVRSVDAFALAETLPRRCNRETSAHGEQNFGEGRLNFKFSR